MYKYMWGLGYYSTSLIQEQTMAVCCVSRVDVETFLKRDTDTEMTTNFNFIKQMMTSAENFGVFSLFLAIR